MPRAKGIELSDTEAAALRDAKADYLTYEDLALEVGVGKRTVELWFQRQGRGRIPAPKLQDLLTVLGGSYPERLQPLRFILKGRALEELQAALARLEREETRERLLAMAGIPAEDRRAAVGPEAARKRGHLAGIVKATALH